MKRKIRLVVCSFLVLALLLWATPALALPPLPHAFYGTVTINSNTAATGTVVSAKINGVDAGSYTTTVVGQYGSLAERDYLAVSRDGANDGDTINFYVNGYDTNQTATFNVGGGPTVVNLSLTIVFGGGGAPAPAQPPVEANLFGTVSEFSISDAGVVQDTVRSEEHTSELQSH